MIDRRYKVPKMPRYARVALAIMADKPDIPADVAWQYAVELCLIGNKHWAASLERCRKDMVYCEAEAKRAAEVVGSIQSHASRGAEATLVLSLMREDLGLWLDDAEIVERDMEGDEYEDDEEIEPLPVTPPTRPVPSPLPKPVATPKPVSAPVPAPKAAPAARPAPTAPQIRGGAAVGPTVEPPAGVSAEEWERSLAEIAEFERGGGVGKGPGRK